MRAPAPGAPTPGADVRNPASWSRISGSCSLAARRNAARAHSSGSAACPASSANSNAFRSAESSGTEAESSMGRAKPGSLAAWNVG